MSRLIASATCLLLTVGCIASVSGESGEAGRVYPATTRGDTVDRYHGESVADPYRWLETDSAETRRFIETQDRLLEGFVSEIPGFETTRKRLEDLRKFDSIGIPVRAGKKLFFTESLAGAKHPRLMVQAGLQGKASQVLDFADKIEKADESMNGFKISPDGKHLVMVSLNGAGWGWADTVRTADGQRNGETLDGIAGNSAIWTKDSKGFFYLRYGNSAELTAGSAEPQARLLYHRLGSDPSEDRVIYERPDRPSMLFRIQLSGDGRFLAIELNDGSSTRNELVYKDLSQPDSKIRTLVSGLDARFHFEGNRGNRFFVRTDLDAPKGKLIEIDLRKPQSEFWIERIPQRDSALTAVSQIGGILVVRSTAHARPVVETWSYDGKQLATLELPTIGLLSGFNDDAEHSTAFYRLNSLHDPGSIYRVDLNSGKSEIHRRPALSHNPDDYEIRQVFYKSFDGTEVPMFLAHRKGSPLKGDHPLFMYGYGHGGWVAFPWFQTMLIQWMDMGGTYALPGIRGGGEYGADWREAGTLLEKPTTIGDYIAAAEWLIDKGYTSKSKLVANGGSASGVVPAAAAVRRPDLFGALVIEFPFLDMLRYHEFTAIKGWTRGYGSSENPEEYRVLRSYSPLHNLEPQSCYPATLTVVAEDDTSTVPMHGYKFTAALQHAQACDRPVLQKFIPGVGHYSYGIDAEESAETEAQILAFLARSLGMKLEG